ncbi:MAG TPA: hypothetical protein PK096_00540 [Candidatus Saccharibacteria bacterium]|nr:hypothetical protein [Candidatus Saccharibacteria bacterium]HRK93842.1 hypothetical protein [Candidatus Saccharibacteria bacterium]
MQTTFNPSAELSSWNRERSSEELRGYVTSRLTSLPDFELE